MKFDIMVHGMKVSSFCVLLKECRLPQTELVKFSSEDVETLRGHPDIMCVKAGRKGNLAEWTKAVFFMLISCITSAYKAG